MYQTLIQSPLSRHSYLVFFACLLVQGNEIARVRNERVFKNARTSLGTGAGIFTDTDIDSLTQTNGQSFGSHLTKALSQSSLLTLPPFLHSFLFSFLLSSLP